MSLELFYKINSKTTVKVDGQNPQEVFQNLATMQSVFSVQKCGCCGSDELRYVVRSAQSQNGKKSFEYPELWCEKCYARLSFGVSDNGQIYPKIKLSQLAVDKSDSDKKRFEENEAYAKKNYGNLMNAGWHKYKAEKQAPPQTPPKTETINETEKEGTPF
jgi:hypothetical protein